MILGSKLPIHNRCPSCREPSERMDAFSRGRVLVSASINPYEILKETWTFRQERSNALWTWGFKVNSTNIYSRRARPGQSFKALSYSTTRAPAPVPLGQLLQQLESKASILGERGVVLCAETSFSLLKPEVDWAGGPKSLSLHDIPVQQLSPKISLGNHQKESFT